MRLQGIGEVGERELCKERECEVVVGKGEEDGRRTDGPVGIVSPRLVLHVICLLSANHNEHQLLISSAYFFGCSPVPSLFLWIFILSFFPRSLNQNGHYRTPPPLPPIPINPEERMKELESLLADESRANYHTNIRAVLEMYKAGTLPDRARPLIIVQDGKVIALKDLDLSGPTYWIEVLYTEYILNSVF